MDSLEHKIGYHFEKPELLQQALTHPSVTYESTQKKGQDNQRLEFLGDAVLQLVLTESLYAQHQTYHEGKLTKLRAQLVSRPALAQFAIDLELGPHLILGKSENHQKGREKPSTLADAFEAIIGAIYLDGGMEPARAFILNTTKEAAASQASHPEAGNPKGELQETLQSVTPPESPLYETIDAIGPDHDRTFTVQVSWKGEVLGKGTGSSKKAAEIDAARVALESGRVQDLVIHEA